MTDVRARFVVDASGQSALLGRRFGLRRWDDFFRNLAVYGYYRGARRLPPPDETNIFIESYRGGWLWTIPLHTGVASVGAVVDAAAGRERLRDEGAERFLASQIAQAPHTSAMLRDAALRDGPHVARDWSYVSERTAGDRFVMVGDAACFVDPLFSSGVHLAMMSGVLAAAYVTTALRNPDMREDAARVYEELYRKEYDHFRELARLFYSSNRTEESYFWEARRLLDAGDALAPRQAFVRALAGQSARGYERVALERGEPPADVVEGVRAVERARAERDGAAGSVYGAAGGAAGRGAASRGGGRAGAQAGCRGGRVRLGSRADDAGPRGGDAVQRSGWRRGVTHRRARQRGRHPGGGVRGVPGAAAAAGGRRGAERAADTVRRRGYIRPQRTLALTIRQTHAFQAQCDWPAAIPSPPRGRGLVPALSTPKG